MMDQNNHQVQENAFDIGSALKSMVGFVILIVGVSLGLYIVTIGLGLINADDPPAIVDKLTQPCIDEAQGAAVAVVDAVNPEEGADAKKNLLRLELSSDIKQIVGYVIIFLLLAITLSFAATMVHSGVKLMHRDASEALKAIAARLKS